MRLYLNPSSGDLKSYHERGFVAIDGDFTSGVTAPVVLFCRLHGVYEAVGKVTVPGARGRSVQGVYAFLRCALAAAAGTCRTYRTWRKGLGDSILQIVSGPATPAGPVRAWREIGAVFGMRVPFVDALRALASLQTPHMAPLVVAAHPMTVVSLDPTTGSISASPGTGRVPPGCLRLPSDAGWLIIRCPDHGWEMIDTLPAISQADAVALVEDMATVICADGVDTCAEFHKRIEILRERAPTAVTDEWYQGKGLWPLLYAQQLADAIVRVTGDIGWLVAEILMRSSGY